MPYENQFAALGHPLRQSIVRQLTTAPASVRALTDALPASQPVISQHLKVLRETGLVRVETRGARNIYSIEADQLDKLRAFLEQHWLSSLKTLGETAPDD